MHFSTLPATVVSAFLVSFATVLVPSPSTLAASRFAVARGTRAAAVFLSAVVCLDVSVFVLLALGFQPILHRLGASAAFVPLAGVALCVGGIAILATAPRQVERLVSVRGQRRLDRTEALHGPFVAGLIVPAANPGFWLWWTTVGTAFIHAARQWGRVGLTLLFAAFFTGVVAWYVPLLFALRHGRRQLSPEAQVRLLAVLGMAMVGFGIYLLWRFFIGGA